MVLEIGAFADESAIQLELERVENNPEFVEVVNTSANRSSESVDSPDGGDLIDGEANADADVIEAFCEICNRIISLSIMTISTTDSSCRR